MHTLLKLREHNKNNLMFLTKGNGSSSSLVKELKGYNEEAIRSTQHWFKCQELLEWDQSVSNSVLESVFNRRVKKTKKTNC